MNWRGFALGFALTLPLTVAGVADAAPRPAAGTITLGAGFPTVFVPAPGISTGTVGWTYSKDVTKGGGNVFIQAACYQGEKIESPDTLSHGRNFVTSHTTYLNSGLYGRTAGTVTAQLWGWETPGDAWCYVAMADWGKGSYTTYTVPTVIAVSEQWLVDDPRT